MPSAMHQEQRYKKEREWKRADEKLVGADLWVSQQLKRVSQSPKSMSYLLLSNIPVTYVLISKFIWFTIMGAMVDNARDFFYLAAELLFTSCSK